MGKGVFTSRPPASRGRAWHVRARSGTAIALAALSTAVVPFVALGAVAGHHAAAANATVTEFPIPTGSSAPTDITTGPDGNLWFTENSGNKIGQITPSGTITEFSIPTPSSAPQSITAGPDGNLWFTENAGNNIGMITPSGTITEFPVTTPGSGLWGITSGPDGNLWFTEYNASNIGKITTAGAVSEFGGAFHPLGITTGPDGSLWAADNGQFDVTTTAGSVTTFSVPVFRGTGGIVSGPDGNVWSADMNSVNTTNVTSISTAGTNFTEYVIARPSNPSVQDVTVGPNGALWATDQSGNVVEVSTAGAVTKFPIPTTTGMPDGITTGPDGNMWFTESSGNSIGQLVIPTTCASVAITPPGTTPNAGRLGLPNTGPGLLASVTLTVANCGTNPLSSVTTSTTTTPPAGCGPAPALTEVSSPTLAGGSSAPAVMTTFTAPSCVGTYTVTSQVLASSTLVGSSTQAYVDAIGGVGIQSPFQTAGQPGPVVTGSDGNLWFTVAAGRYIGRLTPSGVVTQFLTPNSEFPQALTPGPDGSIWVAENSSAGFDIAKFATDGTLKLLLPLPTGLQARNIASGPDGNVWITESGSQNAIARVAPDGRIKQFNNLNLPSSPRAIAAGSDGNLWFICANGFGTNAPGVVGRLTPSGIATFFSTTSTDYTDEIGLGSDGNMWFTETSHNLVGRITPSGVVTEFPIGINVRPNGITPAADGDMWFDDSQPAAGFYNVGRITPAGVVTVFSEDVFVASSGKEITAGPDGNVWVSANNARRVSQIATGAPTSCTALSLTTNPFSVGGGASETINVPVTNCQGTPQLFKLSTKTTPPGGCGSATTAKVNLWLAPRTGTTETSTFTAPSCTGPYKVVSTLSIGTSVVAKTTSTYNVT